MSKSKNVYDILSIIFSIACLLWSTGKQPYTAGYYFQPFHAPSTLPFTAFNENFASKTYLNTKCQCYKTQITNNDIKWLYNDFTLKT
jgi:hypothetical protein